MSFKESKHSKESQSKQRTECQGMDSYKLVIRAMLKLRYDRNQLIICTVCLRAAGMSL